jgi:hypothetical protein
MPLFQHNLSALQMLRICLSWLPYRRTAGSLQPERYVPFGLEFVVNVLNEKFTGRWIDIKNK